MEENNNRTYQVIDMSENETKNKKQKNTFGKNVFLPFCSGVIGASLVIGGCFGVPEIRNYLFQNTGIIQTSTSSSENSSTPSSLTSISLTNYSDTGMKVANKVLPSIVGIKVEYTTTSIFSRNPSTSSAEGSGIIISEDGYILTNNHIVNSTSSNSFYTIEEASKVSVFLYNDETEYSATIVGTDEQTDLAVIKIDKTGLTPAELGNSDNVKVGEFSMAIGNPLGMQSSVTAGIISAVNREVTDSDGKNFILIQTDAAINSGNSGGALVNAEGQVIGINTLKLAGTGIEGMGFAIPINDTIDIYNQLIKNGKVLRPYIGITGIDVDQRTAMQYNYPQGIYVKAIDKDAPISSSDLKPGDIIVSIENTTVKTMDELNEIKKSKNIGDTVKLGVYRNGETIEISIILGEQP